MEPNSLALSLQRLHEPNCSAARNTTCRETPEAVRWLGEEKTPCGAASFYLSNLRNLRHVYPYLLAQMTYR